MQDLADATCKVYEGNNTTNTLNNKIEYSPGLQIKVSKCNGLYTYS